MLNKSGNHGAKFYFILNTLSCVVYQIWILTLLSANRATQSRLHRAGLPGTTGPVNYHNQTYRIRAISRQFWAIFDYLKLNPGYFPPMHCRIVIVSAYPIIIPTCSLTKPTPMITSSGRLASCRLISTHINIVG